MGVQKAKGRMYPVAISFVMVMLHNAYCCVGAAVIVKSNTTTVRYNSHHDLIEDDYELELEFLMNPYISRILQTAGSHPAENAVNNPNSAACTNDECSKGCQKQNEFDRQCKKPGQ